MSQTYLVFALLKKNDGVSDEEFRRNWEKEHAPKLVPLMRKHGAVWYSQTYTNREKSNAISQAIYKDNAHSLDYDGIATTVFPSAEAAEAYMKDPEKWKILAENPRTFVHDATYRAGGGEEVVLLNLMSDK
ncbi:hypothetical protein CPB86DRAFT_800176 [Serendipita vermifera]|nr:hypothetical protein CPB86DRAFT_800176 [Serendipita vermifera]